MKYLARLDNGHALTLELSEDREQWEVSPGDMPYAWLADEVGTMVNLDRTLSITPVDQDEEAPAEWVGDPGE